MKSLAYFRLGDGLQAILGLAMWRLEALHERIRGRAQMAAAEREIDGLDQRGLQDIGIDRSEIGSCMAESTRLAERTRLRISHAPR